MKNTHSRKYKKKVKVRKKVKMLFDPEIKTRHDFAYRQSKKNPYKRIGKKVNRKKTVEITILILSFVGTAIVLLLHPFFQIKSIEISGTDRIEMQDIRDTIDKAFSKKKLFIFSSGNYLLVDLENLKELLKEKYSLASVEMNKNFSEKKIYINIEEKISSIIYDNGEDYYLIGLDGTVIEHLKVVQASEWIFDSSLTTSTDGDGELIKSISTTTIHIPDTYSLFHEVGDYPILYDHTSSTSELASDEDTIIQIDPKLVHSILEWYNLSKMSSAYDISYIVLEKKGGDARIKTKVGYDIHIKILEQAKDQHDSLEMSLKDKIDTEEISYIDLRYPDRIYWK